MTTDIHKIDDGLSVAPQIAADDMAALKAAGFRAIMSNRPDGEEAAQPPFAAIAKAAAEAGLEARHVPVRSGAIEDADVAAFARALETLPGPVLAFCRTGTRSTILWALSQAGHRPTAEILRVAQGAGYDLSGVAPRLDAMAASASDRQAQSTADG